MMVNVLVKVKITNIAKRTENSMLIAVYQESFPSLFNFTKCCYS